MWIWGNGGHAKVVREATRVRDWPTIVDGDERYPWKEFYSSMPGVIAIGDNKTRKRIADRLGPEQQYATIFDPSHICHQHGFINDGAGSVFLAGSVVQTWSAIGDHVIINTCASVDHDCWISDFVHIAPGAHLCGNVKVGEGTLVGAGTIVTPGVTIGPWLVIPAGSVVTKDCLNETDVASLRRR